MKSARKIISLVLKVVVVLVTVASVGCLCLFGHRGIVEQNALMTKAKDSQTVMPQEHIYIDPHQVVRIREMPLGSRGWTSREAILVGKGGRCFLDLSERVELKVKPDFPAVELRSLKDGTYQATVLDNRLTWEPSGVTGSERSGSMEQLYFPLRVSFPFPDSQKADAR